MTVGALLPVESSGGLRTAWSRLVKAPTSPTTLLQEIKGEVRW